MAATGIIALFSVLSAASAGAHHSASGLLTMLCACRWVQRLYPSPNEANLHSCIVSSLVSVLVQSTHVVLLLLRSSQRRKESRRMHNTDGLPWPQVRSNSSVTTAPSTYMFSSDTMIDFGFVISTFVPLVLFW